MMIMRFFLFQAYWGNSTKRTLALVCMYIYIYIYKLVRRIEQSNWCELTSAPRAYHLCSICVFFYDYRQQVQFCRRQGSAYRQFGRLPRNPQQSRQDHSNRTALEHRLLKM